MPFTIAVAGKGGTGKTTIAGFLIQILQERRDGPILAIDADPNANLNELLGMEVGRTIGELREGTLEGIADLPPGLPKEQYLELGLHECLVEDEGLDLLAMGRGEGPKCYCMINHILRKYIDLLRGNYKYVVIDNEAGMEHLSRRTTQDVDALLIIAQGNPISIRSAERISELAERLKLRVTRRYLLLNNVDGELPEALREEIDRLGFPLLGRVPYDEEVNRFSLLRRPLRELPAESPAKCAMAEVLIKLLEDR